MQTSKNVKDQYANKAYGSCTESAANTLTFNEIPTNVSMMDKIAWIISRIEWVIPATTLAFFAADSDRLTMALTASKTITTIGLDDPAVIDRYDIQAKYLGAAASGNIIPLQWLRDFSGLPGGGLIVAPRPLYVAAQGGAMASACTVQCRIYFTTLELDAASYIDLIDFYRIIG